MIKVSVITVCFNAENTIKKTLDSISKQDYKNIEHIVIDGASSDNTMSIIGQDNAHSRTIVSEKDNGIYDAMNKGVSIASGDIVGFLNADDFFFDNTCLSKVVDVYNNSCVDLCYGDLFYVDRSNINKKTRFWKSGIYRESLLESGWSPPHPTFYARRSIFQQYGLFNTKYKLAADQDWMSRVLHSHNTTPAYINYPLVCMRNGGVTNRNIINIIKQNIEILTALRSNGIRPSYGRYLFAKLSNRFNQYFNHEK